MSTVKTKEAMEIFSGFNTVNPDELLQGLMKLFMRVSSAKDYDQEALHFVVAVLHTAEFVEQAKPELSTRLAVIKRACIDKLRIASKNIYAEWVKEILHNYK